MLQIKPWYESASMLELSEKTPFNDSLCYECSEVSIWDTNRKEILVDGEQNCKTLSDTSSLRSTDW